MNTLEESAKGWDDLAEQELNAIILGIACSPSTNITRANIYKRTAEALRIQDRTGIAVCSCCHKPFPKR